MRAPYAAPHAAPERVVPLRRGPGPVPRVEPAPRVGQHLGLSRAAGVLGPAAFVTAWAVGGAVTDGYSPVRDAISELAQLGAPTRLWMTAGMVAFGVSMPLFARLLPRRAAVAAVAAGVGTLAVAAFPLDPGESVPAHAAAAGVAYVATAAMPALSGNVPLGAVALALLAASVVADGPGGLLQRAGLTLVDAWIVARALGLRSGDGPATPTR